MISILSFTLPFLGLINMLAIFYLFIIVMKNKKMLNIKENYPIFLFVLLIASSKISHCSFLNEYGTTALIIQYIIEITILLNIINSIFEYKKFIKKYKS